MRRSRGKSIAIAVALGAAAFLGIAGYAARHRVFELWYIHRLETGDAAARLEAIGVLGRIGSRRAVPPLGAVLASGSTEERHAAIEALGSLGPMAADAAPHLVRLIIPDPSPGNVESPEAVMSSRAERALERIGPASIPALSAGLQVAYPSKIASVIVRFDEGIPHLISLLDHEDDRVAAAARAALRLERQRTAMPLLETALDARAGEHARLATHVLWTMAEEALGGSPALSITAFPRLNAARKDALPAPAVCSIVADVLGIDAGRVQDLAPRLDPDVCVQLRVTALYSIRRLPKQAQPILPDLIECVLTDAECRQHAADTLALLGPPVVPALVEVLAGPDAQAALWAESILVETGARSGQAASAIVQGLLAKPEPLRRRLVDVLHNTGKTGSDALREAAASGEEALRPVAAQAFAEIEARP